MRTSVLFGAKNFGFIEIYGVSVRTKGREFNQCGHFADKGVGGQFFAILCGRLLWTAPNVFPICLHFCSKQCWCRSKAMHNQIAV